MPSKKVLQERRHGVGRDLDAMAVRLMSGGISDADAKAWDAKKREYDDLTEQIRRAEVGETRDTIRTDAEARPGNPPGSDGGDRQRGYRIIRDDRPDRPDAAERRAVAESRALGAWIRRAHGKPLHGHHTEACRALGLSPNRRTFTINLPRRPLTRSLSATTGTAGGYTVPTGFVPSLEKSLKQFASLRQVADVIRTEGGNNLPWPTVDDTSNVGERIAENTAVTEQDPTFGQVVFGAYKYSSKLVRVPTELLEDNDVNLAEWLGNLLGERLGRVQAVDFSTGTGVSQPQGIVTAASLGKTAASATAVTADEILDLIHSIDPAYRSDPSFALMMSDSVLAAVRKLKESGGAYLFHDPRDGGPVRCFGTPVIVNPQMATAMTTGQKIMLAGAFSKYKIRDVDQVRFRRLEERYAESDQVGFLAFLRSDAKMLDAGTDPVKYLALA